MPNYLHRTTKQYLVSVSPINLPEPEANYIVRPNLSAVAGVPSKYWIITGDIVSQMSAAEKSTVDAAEETAQRDARISRAIDDLEGDLRQIVKMLISEINILRQQFNTTTGEVSQLTTTTLSDRTLAQVRAQLRSEYGS